MDTAHTKRTVYLINKQCKWQSSRSPGIQPEQIKRNYGHLPLTERCWHPKSKRATRMIDDRRFIQKSAIITHRGSKAKENLKPRQNSLQLWNKQVRNRILHCLKSGWNDSLYSQTGTFSLLVLQDEKTGALKQLKHHILPLKAWVIL